MKPIAYLEPLTEEWFCPDCAPDEGDAEGWVVAFHGEAVDTPQHCTCCGVLLDFAATDDAVEYVAEHVVEMSKQDQEMAHDWLEWAYYNGNRTLLAEALLEEWRGYLLLLLKQKFGTQIYRRQRQLELKAARIYVRDMYRRAVALLRAEAACGDIFESDVEKFASLYREALCILDVDVDLEGGETGE